MEVENIGFKYHRDNSLFVTEKDEKLAPFELKLDFELQKLDISVVNGLRRILYAEVESISVSPDVLIDESQNITVFNTEYIKDRMALLPIHLNNLKELEKFKEGGEFKNLIFRIADPDNWNKPLVNDQNEDRAITCQDILVLERISEIVDDLAKDQEEAVVEEGGKVDEVDEEDDVVVDQGEEQDVAAAADVIPPAADPALAESQPDISPDSEKLRYRILPSRDFFVYQNMYLAKLKKGESLYLVMRPEVGQGKEHARWSSCIVEYGFKTKKEIAKENDPERYQWWTDETYDPVRDYQDYMLSEDTSVGKYGTPEVFMLSLEYNGHYRPSHAWLGAVSKLKSKVEWFLEQIRLIRGENEELSDRVSVEFSPKDRIRNLITLTIYGEDHTLGNLMFSHYLYNLEKLVKVINPDNSNEIMLTGFSHYRIPHVLDPIENKLLLVFKTPEWSRDQIEKGFGDFLGELAGTGEVVNPYDDEFYVKNPTVRLLMIVTERILNVLTPLEREAAEIVKLAESNQIPYREQVANMIRQQ